MFSRLKVHSIVAVCVIIASIFSIIVSLSYTSQSSKVQRPAVEAGQSAVIETISKNDSDSITEFCYKGVMYLKYKDSITAKYYLNFIEQKVQSC